MKENRKLLREILEDIRHDMTDEEVLNLLADSKISVNPAGEKEKYNLGHRAVRGQLGIHLLLHRRVDPMDGRQHAAGGKGIRLVPLHPAQSGALLRGGHSGAAHHDEPESAGRKGPPPRGERL